MLMANFFCLSIYKGGGVYSNSVWTSQLYLFCVYVCSLVCSRVIANMLWSEDNLKELVLSFHNVGPGIKLRSSDYAPNNFTPRVICQIAFVLLPSLSPECL